VWQTYPSIIVNKIAYVTLRDKFVTKLIVDVSMLNRLDENVNNFLLYANVNNIFWIKNVSNYFLDQNVSMFYNNPPCGYNIINTKIWHFSFKWKTPLIWLWKMGVNFSFTIYIHQKCINAYIYIYIINHDTSFTWHVI